MDMDGLAARSLLVWITVADACLYNPKGAMGRLAANSEKMGEVSKFITDLEKVCGKKIVSNAKFSNPFVLGQRRGGYLTWEGVLLADICACVEHLWSFFITTNGGPRACQKFRPVKDVIFKLLETEIRRDADRLAYGPPFTVRAPVDAVYPDRASRHWAALRQEWVERQEMKPPQDHFIYKMDDAVG